MMDIAPAAHLLTPPTDHHNRPQHDSLGQPNPTSQPGNPTPPLLKRRKNAAHAGSATAAQSSDLGEASGKRGRILRWCQSLRDHAESELVPGSRKWSEKCPSCGREDVDKKRLRDSLCVGFPLEANSAKAALQRIRHVRANAETTAAIDKLMEVLPAQAFSEGEFLPVHGW